MKITFTFLISALIFVNTIYAQSLNRCSAMEYQDYLTAEGLLDPDHLLHMNQAIQQWMDNNPENTGNALITIPIVFHVLYANSNQNIPDSRIFAQLDVLNKDFSRTNADASNTPSIFLSVAADTEIQFCLALRDPAGNATTGINRKSTSTTSWGTNNDIKDASKGGVNAWNTTKYLNVWIGNLSSGLLGYASFPTAAGTNNDGVVLHYRSVGGPGGQAQNDINYAPYHLGRTGTHEIGHWLGLFHTFQGGCAGTSSSTCAGFGDQVCDTPPVSSANFNCNTNANSCTETPTDLPDMVTNFMDYTDDECMNVFTQGQKTRAHAAINTQRNSLFASDGCLPVGINSIEALNNSINIYPNPSSGLFTLNTTFQEESDLNIFVFNILGEQIMSLEKYNLLRSKIDLDMSNFSNGIYYVVFESSGFTTSRKLSVSL